MKNQNINTLTLEARALANSFGIQCCAKFSTDIIMAGIKDATPHQENCNVFDIVARDIICNMDGQEFPEKVINWCWTTFSSLTYNALICDHLKRNVSLSNVGYHAEVIQQFRRSLMIDDNKKMLKFPELQMLNSSTVAVYSLDEYLDLDIKDQLAYASSVYYNILMVAITQCQQAIGIQIQLYKENDIRLIVWGRYEKVKK